ncbi:NAD(P)-dependent oxidoreductase [Streptomyces johnsoniae]|uniref:NAD(P)-binding domain-containing protein n=1 Tax=Streptomyces johnsoniae TaxID=3075532 RepID=A0ABU2S9V3_9ACTN|nr:NAD(P)-binding domain-containing protein [Streptomyces sp. DSM 41886]MDT0445742.1 NAD(P)-binding domain-containing protein [Streptomyces sp. DSM 41886]
MSNNTQVSVLGLGEMGRALAAALLAAGQPTTVWNRTAAKGDELVARGASRADSVEAAVTAGPVVIVCLLDHGSVLETLEPVAGQLAGRTVVNLTTGTPAQAEELSAWVTGHGADFLAGGIMAIPTTVATPDAFFLYSGQQRVFDAHRDVLEVLGEARYLGADTGLASLYDLALLSGMNLMFEGFHHAVAMATSRTEGTAADFTGLLVRWLVNMARVLPAFAAEVDAERESGAEPRLVQTLDLQIAAMANIVDASRAAGVDPAHLELSLAGLRDLLGQGHVVAGAPTAVRRLRLAGPMAGSHVARTGSPSGTHGNGGGGRG